MAGCVLLVCGALGPVRAAGSDPSVVPDLHINLSGWSLVLVRDAVEGALRRVDDTRCRQIFDDFRDAAGQPLAANLSASGLSAKEYLAALRFTDGDELAQCDAYPARVAVTQPRSRVIFICSSHFASSFGSRRRDAAVIILHEMLHSLGLGENPPTSADITRMVQSRCDSN